MWLLLLPIPAPVSVVVSVLASIMVVLLFVAGVAAAYTVCRRAVRHARISQRDEGWGGPRHPNQQLGDELARQIIDAVRGRLPAGRSRQRRARG